MKKSVSIISICLIIVFALTACDLTTVLNKENVQQNIENLVGSTEGSIDETHMATDGREFLQASSHDEIPINARLFATVNSMDLYDTFEETGYSRSDEVCVDRDMRLETFYEDYEGECDYFVIDVTLIYRSEEHKGELLKGDENAFLITSKICPYAYADWDNIEEDGPTTAYFSYCISVFDYELVEDGERAPVENCVYFDMIEGQDLNMVLVFSIPKYYIDNADEFGVAIANAIDSNFGNQHRIIYK